MNGTCYGFLFRSWFPLDYNRRFRRCDEANNFKDVVHGGRLGQHALELSLSSGECLAVHESVPAATAFSGLDCETRAQFILGSTVVGLAKSRVERGPARCGDLTEQITLR